MNASETSQLESLCAKTSKNCSERGAALIAGIEDAASLELLWVSHMQAKKLTGTADCLLAGTLSAIREGAACLALGLVRPAIASLRLQVDLALGWLYFKDHPVEWERVQATGDGFKLKGELLKYLTDNHQSFSGRFSVLKERKTRREEEPYRLLSAHIHAQSEHVIPKVVLPTDIVASVQHQTEFVELQAECSEYINDVYWSVYADKWKAFPSGLTDSLQVRFKTTAQRAAFFG